MSVTGTAAIEGDVAVQGGGARRLTVSGGDLYISGTVRAAGDADRSLVLEAPNGTIYVKGTIDASGTNGTGGGISLSASRMSSPGPCRRKGAWRVVAPATSK